MMGEREKLMLRLECAVAVVVVVLCEVVLCVYAFGAAVAERGSLTLARVTSE